MMAVTADAPVVAKVADFGLSTPTYLKEYRYSYVYAVLLVHL